MTILKSEIDIKDYGIKRLKDFVLNNKNLRITQRSDDNLTIHPKLKTTFPFVAKSKSTSNIYYEMYFDKEKATVSYLFKRQTYYSFIVELLLFIILIVLSFFYPKLLMFSLILFIVLLFSGIINILSFFRAKKFFRKEVLPRDM